MKFTFYLKVSVQYKSCSIVCQTVGFPTVNLKVLTNRSSYRIVIWRHHLYLKIVSWSNSLTVGQNPLWRRSIEPSYANQFDEFQNCSLMILDDQDQMPFEFELVQANSLNLNCVGEVKCVGLYIRTVGHFSKIGSDLPEMEIEVSYDLESFLIFDGSLCKACFVLKIWINHTGILIILHWYHTST